MLSQTDVGLQALHAAPARFDPDRLAIVHDAERWSWRDLDRRSAQWAAQLVSTGVRPNDLVAFSLANGPEFLALTFGVYRAGATPAPLSPKLSEKEMRTILGLMRPRVRVGQHAGIDSPVPAPSKAAATSYAAPTIAASWKACTSGGSTGTPKVIVDRRPAVFETEAAFIGIPDAEAVLVPGPLYHNAPFSAAIFALQRGCTVVTVQRFDAERALATIAQEKVAWALMVPTMMHRILRLPEKTLNAFDLAGWKMVVHTASSMPLWLKEDWIKRFGPDHVWEVYGATEGLARTWIGGREWLERPGSVGRPIGGAMIRILDPHGQELPTGEVGEIYALPPDGPGSTYRYIGAERRAGKGGWESVGDFGWLDPAGYLFIADRRTDLIISGGINIWPAEVEAALLTHPSIASCAVVGIFDEDLGARVHAVVETHDAGLDLEQLRTFLRERLSSEKIPRSMVRSTLPVRDDAGKVRKSLWQDRGSIM